METIRYSKRIVVFFLIFLGISKIQAEQDHVNEASYDFIVVGAGIAGCTLASRLSENGRHSVLLLESGGSPHPALRIPALLPFYLGRNNSYVKVYESVPQKNAALTNNGIVLISNGRTLGGGSAIDGMIYGSRGSPHDYDAWANSTGDHSWSYESMLQYFKKVENHESDCPSDHHGPIPVSRPHYTPGMETIFKAAQYLRYPVNEEANGPQKIGFSPIQFSKRSGRRVSSFMGYILPHLDSRHNLKVLTNVMVKRVIFSGHSAIGVIYAESHDNHHNQLDRHVFVRAKEVILSAGAIETPALLMKSGIGPSDVLDYAGIPQIMNLPVGKNLQDHPSTTLHFVINNRSDVFIPDRDLTYENMRFYDAVGDGPYSTMTGETTEAFLASSKTISEGYPDWSDIHIRFQHSPIRYDFLTERFGNVRNEDEEDKIINQDDHVSVHGIISLGRPMSRGSVTLNMTNIDGDPLIDFNYYSDPHDMEVMLEAIKMTLQIYEDTPAFQKQDARYQPSPLKACRHLPYRTNDYWRCYIKQRTHYGHHAFGTCKMGIGPEDPTAVVDTHLKVIGFENLRVIDGSVIPTINANIQAATYAIAEKGAELILHKWEGETERSPFPIGTAEWSPSNYPSDFIHH